LAQFREYGEVYKHVKSEDIKEQLLQSAPYEVLEAYAIATKNILIGNISLTRQEHKHLKQYKDTLIKLGFQQQSSKARKSLLSEGDLFQTLSKIMAKLKSDIYQSTHQ